MPQRRGENLSGSADGGVPGWEERAKARLNASQAETLRKKGRRRGGQVLIECDVPFLTILRRAADARGLSSTAYARRAIAAFVAADLGLSFSEVCGNFALPHKKGEMMKPDNPDGVWMKPGLTVDDGQGYGKWLVQK